MRFKVLNLLFTVLALPVMFTAGCAGEGGEGDAPFDLPGEEFIIDTQGETDVPPDQPQEPDGTDQAPDEVEDPDALDMAEDLPGEPELPPTCGNGTIDPGEDCDGGPAGSCTTSCSSTGTRTCTPSCTWSACQPPIEECNGADDDCDGTADDGFPCVQGAAASCTTTCVSTGTGTCSATCQPAVPADCSPPAETCNDVDDDCDGDVDEIFTCRQGSTENCTTTSGFPGTHTCSSACIWGDCRIICPSECQVVPTGGTIGSACVSDTSCRLGAYCLTESQEVFGGQTYTTDPGGQCIAYGPDTSVCDTADPTSCPSGSKCMFLGTALGTDYYGCFDTCIVTDASGNPYDFNCGCREGYACDVIDEICLSGCSNNRECCERWWDLNGDYARQPAEVATKSGCTNTCDNTPSGFCEASYECINNGDAANVWSGPCEGDAWCPPDGRCLDEFRYTDSSGNPLFPGGLCIKDRCDLVGRGCTDHGGGCTNLGTSTDPFWVCVGRCHFGRSLLDPSYECRPDRGEEQACMPMEPGAWYTPPGDGSDGYCWPGNFPGGSTAVGGSCTSDTTCTSPYGLGFCATYTGITAPTFCSAVCTQAAAETYSVCGGNDGTGTASGVCWSDTCWEGCGSPDGRLGANGCALSTMACYAVSRFTSVYKDNAWTMPAGLCIPRCTNSAWCLDFWGMPMTCNTTSGVCS